MVIRPICASLVATLVVVSADCTRAMASCQLPGMTEEYQGTDATLAFTLPDTGGFLVNGLAIERAKIGPLLREFLAARPANARAVVVWRPSPSRCDDVAFIAAQAKGSGGAAFDADRSGWPRPVPSNRVER